MGGKRVKAQAAWREANTAFVAKKLAKRLLRAEDQKRMYRTNRVLPMGSLKSREVYRLFEGWICKLEGNSRLLTFKFAKGVCDALREHFGMETLDAQHAKDEISRMQLLLKTARKRKIAKLRPMDALATMPMNQEDSFHSILTLARRSCSAV